MLQSVSWSRQGLASVALSHCSQVAFLPGYLARYCVLGNAEAPPLILIPDVAGGMDLCLPLAQRLGQQFRVYVMQLRGEDTPYELSNQTTAEQLGEDVNDFQNALCLERPMLFGAGFGALVALEAARKFPGRYSGCIVQGIAPSFAAAFNEIANSSNTLVEAMFGSRWVIPQLRHLADQLCRRTDLGVIARRLQMLSQFEMDPLVDGLRQVPLLIQTATHDVFVSPEAWKPWRRVLPRMTLQTIDNAGHFAFLTHIEALTCQVERFANRRLGVPVHLPTT